MDTVKSKPRKISDNQLIITKFIEFNKNIDKYFYGREGKLAKTLIKKYSLKFLLWVPLPYGQKLSSLAFFIKEEGQNYLSSFFFQFKKENPDIIETELIKLLPYKVGEDLVIKKKPKTLKEFLKL